MTWAEALEALKAGKEVRRNMWYSGVVIRTVAEPIDEGVEHQLQFFDEGHRASDLCLALADFEATDWEVSQ
jgi:hypothetical protein